MFLVDDKQNVLSLYQLNELIQKSIDEKFYNKYFWIKAELNKLNIYKYSGHAYPELVQKENNSIICQMRGIIWKNDLNRIQQQFKTIANEELKDGINILILATVKFDAKYGLSLLIKEIDINYSLGELEKEKRNTIELLKTENIFSNNKNLDFPIIPQRLAIISVETSKGYNDLIATFAKYEHQYKIESTLFPSLLQGENAALQIQSQLETINKQIDKYDAVAIIRGGGGEVGLSCYNHYELCRTIACFPIPIITGIGHSTNFTVAEMVAHYNGITPTDTAMFIIKKFIDFDNFLNDNKLSVFTSVKEILNNNATSLQQFSKNISYTCQEIFHQQNIALHTIKNIIATIPKYTIQKQKHQIKQYSLQVKSQAIRTKILSMNRLAFISEKLNLSCKKFFEKNYEFIDNTQKQVDLMHPRKVLQRGYSIIFNQTKTIKSVQDLSVNQSIKIMLHDGEVQANITQIQNNDL